MEPAPGDERNRPDADARMAAEATLPVKAREVALLRSDSAEDAAVVVFCDCLDHFEANRPVFRQGEPPESVHQMRVALRRLRAALGLFRPVVAGPALDAARGAAKEMGAALGAARNWDVFQDLLAAGPGPALANDPGQGALLDAIAARRARAYRAAAAAIEGPPAQALLDDFREAIAGRDWTVAPQWAEEGSAREFARAALARLRRRVRRKSKGLAGLSAPQRHRVRIALKKARYGAEFFQSLFGGEAAAADFIAALAKLQDGLGVYTDMAMAAALLDEIDADADAGPGLRASGFVRGWFAHAAQAGDDHARKSEKRLRRLEPFWE
jgi:CHAD domain-containing protein